MRPSLTIVVNNHNYARFLSAAIDSALLQDSSGLEIVVVDDGSTDRSRDVIRAYGDRVITVFKENGGQASTFNAALPVSHGDVLLFLDADDILLPGAGREVCDHFARRPLAKLHWPLLLIDDVGARSGGCIPTNPLPDGDLRDTVIRDGPDSFATPPTSGNAWARSVLSVLSPIPEDVYRLGADGYLNTLAPLYGPVGRVAKPLGGYRVHGSNSYYSGTMNDLITRSLVRYERRSRTLCSHLRDHGIDADPASWRVRNRYYRWLLRLEAAAREIAEHIPSGATFLLVDGHEWGRGLVPGRRDIPFLERDGQYWGAPADDWTAIRELQRLLGQAHFIVFGWPCFWWFEYYPVFSAFVRANFPCTLENERLAIFDLRSRT